MRLNRNIELGIRAVSALKTKTGPTKIVDLAGEIGTTVNFLEQIMRNLRVAGIVGVKRGPGGGCFLYTNSTHTAFDVARAVGKFSIGLDAGDTSPTNQLRIAVSEAFRNVTI